MANDGLRPPPIRLPTALTDPLADPFSEPSPGPQPDGWIPALPGAASASDSDLDWGLASLQSGPDEPGTLPAQGRRQWRLYLLVVLAALGLWGVVLLTDSLVQAPHIDAVWRDTAQGRIELAASHDPLLAAHHGQVLSGMVGGDTTVSGIDALAFQRSARWIIDDADRARQVETQAQLGAALAHANVQLLFADGSAVDVQPQPRGITGLPLGYWLLMAGALGLFLLSLKVLLARPTARNLVYAAMCCCQAGNLAFIAFEITIDLGGPEPFSRLDMPVRMAFDLITAAAMVHAVCLHPRRLPGAAWIALSAWALALAVVGLGATDRLLQLWWWVQGSVALMGLAAIALLSWSYQIERHPFAIVMLRFGVVTLATWLLMTAALAAAAGTPGMQHNIAGIGSLTWYLFLASLLMLIPFMAKSQQVMREFSLLAAISTVATSLELLFITVFALDQFAALTLSLFISLGLYTGTRQWLLNQLLGSGMLSTERMFEQLYRIAREVEAYPERAPALLSQLLRDVFEPMEVSVVQGPSSATRVARDGSTMMVPVPALGGDAGARPASIIVRFARHGRRLFTAEDSRLTDRIVEQLRRAVAFDKAVEQGRSEERLRLAQDLHDDIGARLLTLMYKAQSPEMEDYVRHTLQDLKTLTRGLAAPNHRLSHAAAEWKADLSQRLSAAHIELRWSFVADDDILLTVVHWSALTRVLRELVSNAIAHAQALCLDIDFSLESDRLDLTVTDDGIGRNPRAWSHGLGLGGIRKRVKQLGGTVEWREVAPHGISCSVIIRELSARV